MALAPGRGPGGCRTGDCEDSVAPPWAVATCNSFWSWGEKPPVICGDRDRNRPQRRAFETF